ncbi:TetR/AcrR family transcriptional regulator [Catellatospora citrea]|uniref:TetR family transcriptional regulator n=1 Tax=Catellatospora citrea TaxID=53366 RepID=A0A8J3KJ76_9ACTN|nr:TetR/AcrR family transcriptional regulator [Catellatospora citrea]RKE12650.1 TetR family transcriptional regulator [Catellatospora citrea]GIF96114.1 TetR family transcriptional regulator [Catellatospora citrea]
MNTAAADLDEVAMLERAWHDVSPAPARRLLIAAVQAFAERGYHATTTRDIATRVGMSPAGVYVHYRSKEELLYRICLVGHRHSLVALRAAAARSDDPVQQLRDVIGDFAAWHALFHTPARVISYELNALEPAHLTEITALRHEMDLLVRATLEHGVARGVFDVPDIPGTGLALLSLTVDVARWYRTSGRRAPEDIGALYADLAVRMVQAR